MDLNLLETYLNEIEEKSLEKVELDRLKLFLKQKGEYRNINPLITQLNKLNKDNDINNIKIIKITLLELLLGVYIYEVDIL